MPGAIVFGGAGFVGSNICAAFARAGWRVTAVDGLMARSTGDAANLTRLADGVELVAQPVEKIADLRRLIEGRDVIVDAMGWTRHHEAIRDPAYDLALNVGSHLPLILACIDVKPPRVVSLASRHQYGRTPDRTITEQTVQAPIDVQGVHKIAAEQHWRLGAEKGFACASLRFGNTFGPNQPVGAGDAGLIGGFIRDALNGATIELFGGHRVRNLLYAPDLAAAIVRLSGATFDGFNVFNVAGVDVTIGELVRTIVSNAGRGEIVEKPMPEHIARIDIGEAAFDGSRFEALAGKVAVTPIPEALRLSVEDARKRLGL